MTVLSLSASPLGRRPKEFRAFSLTALQGAISTTADEAIASFRDRHSTTPDYIRASTAKDGVWYNVQPGEYDRLFDRSGKPAGEVWALRL